MAIYYIQTFSYFVSMIKLSAYEAKLARILALKNEESIQFSPSLIKNIPQIAENEMQIFYGQKKK